MVVRTTQNITESIRKMYLNVALTSVAIKNATRTTETESNDFFMVSKSLLICFAWLTNVWRQADSHIVQISCVPPLVDTSNKQLLLCARAPRLQPPPPLPWAGWWNNIYIIHGYLRCMYVNISTYFLGSGCYNWALKLVNSNKTT